MKFKFYNLYTELIKEMDGTEYYPRTNNYVIFNETRYQVTAIHYDYDDMVVHFYCA